MLGNLRRQFGIGPADHPDEQDALAALRQVDSRNRLCGAEINSISHLMGQDLSVGKVTEPLHLHFLGSDTQDGEWTVRVLELYYGECGGVGSSVSSEPIVGLSGDDCDRFARTGLRNLVKACARCLTSGVGATGGMTRVINATGGYKAQISFAGLIGQVLKVPVVYLFEQFPRCIELPPLPVGFDRALWIEHYPLFARLSDELIVPAREFATWYIAPEVETLLDHERIDDVDYLTLSPILELLHQGFALISPPDLTEPPKSDTPIDKRIRVSTKEQGHPPRGVRQCLERLAGLPWVCLASSEGFVNTGERWRVKPGGTSQTDEILVLFGDGDKAQQIRLTTTCTTPQERQWCLEQLKGMF